MYVNRKNTASLKNVGIIEVFHGFQEKDILKNFVINVLWTGENREYCLHRELQKFPLIEGGGANFLWRKVSGYRPNLYLDQNYNKNLISLMKGELRDETFGI